MNDGGPAFPCEIETASVYYNRDLNKNVFEKVLVQGMTMRDYFAGQAINAMLVRLHEYDKQAALGNDGIDELLSKACYQIADAMIKAREAK